MNRAAKILRRAAFPGMRPKNIASFHDASERVSIPMSTLILPLSRNAMAIVLELNFPRTLFLFHGPLSLEPLRSSTLRENGFNYDFRGFPSNFKIK